MIVWMQIMFVSTNLGRLYNENTFLELPKKKREVNLLRKTMNSFREMLEADAHIDGVNDEFIRFRGKELFKNHALGSSSRVIRCYYGEPVKDFISVGHLNDTFKDLGQNISRPDGYVLYLFVEIKKDYSWN